MNVAAEIRSRLAALEPLQIELADESEQHRGGPETQQAGRVMREELVKPASGVQEAQKAGLAKNAEVQAQMDIARQEILVGAYLRDWAKKHPVSDVEIQKEYDRARAQSG